MAAAGPERTRWRPECCWKASQVASFQMPSRREKRRAVPVEAYSDMKPTEVLRAGQAIGEDELLAPCWNALSRVGRPLIS